MSNFADPEAVSAFLREKRRIFVAVITRNANVEIEGVSYHWQGFGFDADGSRFVRYVCGRCFREELKDAPERLVVRMEEHAARCVPLHLVKSQEA